MTVTIRFAAILTGALLCGFGASGASAQAERGTTKVVEVVQAQPAAVTDDEETATCSKSRKRLWVEGEGWIVRRVNTCR